MVRQDTASRATARQAMASRSRMLRRDTVSRVPTARRQQSPYGQQGPYGQAGYGQPVYGQLPVCRHNHEAAHENEPRCPALAVCVWRPG